jgi:hypothetical protein
LIPYKLEISRFAEKEYISTFRYYEKQVSGLGIRFEKETGRLPEKYNPIPSFSKEVLNTIERQFIRLFLIS